MLCCVVLKTEMVFLMIDNRQRDDLKFKQRCTKKAAT